MVNSVCQFDCAKGGQADGKTLHLGVSVMVFWEEISILIGRLGKKIPLTSAGGRE